MTEASPVSSALEPVSGVGHGKVILLGEHSVVYGYPALATALEGGVRLRARPGSLSIELPEWGLIVDVEEDARGAPLWPMTRVKGGRRTGESPAARVNTPAPPLVASATSRPLGLPWKTRSPALAASRMAASDSGGQPASWARAQRARATATVIAAEEPRPAPAQMSAQP